MPCLLFPTRLLWGPTALLLPACYTQKERAKQRHKDKLREGSEEVRNTWGLAWAFVQTWEILTEKVEHQLEFITDCILQQGQIPAGLLHREATFSPAACLQKYLPCVRVICLICYSCETKQLLIMITFSKAAQPKHLASRITFSGLTCWKHWTGLQILTRSNISHHRKLQRQKKVHLMRVWK